MVISILIMIINMSSPVVVRVVIRSSPSSRSSTGHTKGWQGHPLHSLVTSIITWCWKVIRWERMFEIITCHQLLSVHLAKNFDMTKLPPLLEYWLCRSSGYGMFENVEILLATCITNDFSYNIFIPLFLVSSCAFMLRANEHLLSLFLLQFCINILFLPEHEH